MFGYGDLSDFLKAQLLPLLGVALLLGLGLLTLFLSGIARHRRMRQARAGEDIETFVEELSRYGYDKEITYSTYDYLVREEDVAFPIRPDDRFDEDLRINDDEVQRMVGKLLAENGRAPGPGVEPPAVMATVIELLRFLQACPVSAERIMSGEHRIASSYASREMAEQDAIAHPLTT